MQAVDYRARARHADRFTDRPHGSFLSSRCRLRRLIIVLLAIAARARSGVSQPRREDAALVRFFAAVVRRLMALPACLLWARRLCLRELFEYRFMQTDPNWSNFLYNRDTGT